MIFLENISWLVRDSSRIEQGTSLLIDGNRIAAIGKPAPEIPGLFRVDCRGKAVIPGLINAHTHLWQLLLRGCRDDYPLDKWCNEITLPLIQALKGSVPPKTDISSQLSYLWMQAGICEMLRCGTTGFIDMDLEYVPNGLGRACKDIGMRGNLALEMSDTWYKKDAKACERTRETVVRFAEEFNDPDGTLKVILGPSEPSMCSPDLMRWAGETAARLNLGIQIHVDETRQDVLNLRKLTDKSVFEYLDQFGLLSDRFSAVHCVHISQKDVELAKKRGISVIYNPKSNMKLGSGIAPISSLLKAGVNVALATDGPASNDTLDLPEEMRAGAMLQKVAAEDPSALSARDVFRMATAGGAAAMGVNSGVLDEGKLADLAILDMSAGNLLCFSDDIIPLIVYCLRSENVESVIVNGKVLMLDHKILNTDEGAILRELRISAKKYLV